MQDINAQMPVNAFLECEGVTFRIKSGYIIEAICRSFEASLTFSAFERHEASTFLGKFCTLSITDTHGEKRTWVGECQSLGARTDDGIEWHYTFSFESILSRLRKTTVQLRTETEVDIQDWVRSTLKRHGIFNDAIDWRFECREARSRLIQVLQTDYDFLLKILAQENIIMWPATDKPKLCFSSFPEQWQYGSIERIFYTGTHTAIQHGGEKIGIFDYQDCYQLIRCADEEDKKPDWENKDPERLYSGVPYLVDGMGGPSLRPCKKFEYDQKSLEAIFRRRETSQNDKGEVYRYIDATSNALAIAVGNWINVVDSGKCEETKCRVSYVKHELSSSGKTLRYKNRMLLQPSMALWRAVSPLKPILPLVMQAYIEGDEDAPRLNAFGEEQVLFPDDATQTPKPMDIPRMRAFVERDGGMSFPLGHRTEVLVSFLYGEADLPIIVGALPNADKPSVVNGTNPWDHILKTRSGNMLRFNDDPVSPSVVMQTSPLHGIFMQNGKGIDLRSEGGFVMDVKGRILCQIGKSWNMLAGDSMNLSARLSHTVQTTEGDMTLSSAMDMNATIQKSMNVFVQSKLNMTDKHFKMNVNENATLTIQQGDVQYQIKGAVLIQGGDGIRIVGGKRIVLQSGKEGAGLIMEPNEITLYGKDFLGIETDELELKGNVSFSTQERVTNPVEMLKYTADEETTDEIKKLVLHHINVYGPTEFYGKTVMPGELDGLLYVVSTEPMSIDTFVKSLFDEPSDEKMNAIVSANPHLKGCIEPGQMVYAVDPKSDVYLKFGDSLRACAQAIEFSRQQQLPEEASSFAKQFALMATFGESVGGAPGHYSTFEKPADSVGADDVAGVITTAGNEYFRQQIAMLQQIDDAYRAHPMSADFIAARTQALKDMDVKTIELLDTLVSSKNLTSGKVLDASIRMQVGVQEWMPTANKLASISQQYNGALKASNVLKIGGNVLIGYDALSTYEKIQESCTKAREDECRLIKAEETGGFSGRVAGGGAAAFGVTLALSLAPMTAGASLVVGVVASGIAGYYGSKYGDIYGRDFGVFLLESYYEI